MNKEYTLDVNIEHVQKNKKYELDVDMSELRVNSRNSFNNALKLYTSGKDYLYNKWDKNNSLKNLSKSKEICDKLIENNTKNLDVYILLGDIQSIIGNYQEAIKIYSSGLSMPSKNDFLYKENKIKLEEKKAEALKKIS